MNRQLSLRRHLLSSNPTSAVLIQADDIVEEETDLLVGAALELAITKYWNQTTPGRICRMLEPAPLTQPPRLPRPTLPAHKRFANGGEVIEFITECLVCHAVVERDRKYEKQMTVDPFSKVLCEFVVKNYASETILERMMTKNSAAADFVLFKGKPRRPTANMARKRDALQVALAYFKPPTNDLLLTFSKNKSSNLYRLLAFVRRYLYFLRDEHHISFDQKLCSDIPRLLLAITRRHLIEKFDIWIRANKKKLFAEEVQLFAELDENADFSNDIGVEGPEVDILSEEEALLSLVETEELSTRVDGLCPGIVNPSSMVNMLTDISNALRHTLEYFVIGPQLVCYEDALDARDLSHLDLVGKELQAQRLQRDSMHEFIMHKTTAYRRERDSNRRSTSSKEAKIKLGRYPLNGYDDLFTGFVRLRTVWLDPVAEFILKCSEDDGLSREAIVKLIPVEDALCFQWALIYGVLLLAATVRSEVLKDLTWELMDRENFVNAQLPPSFKTAQSCRATCMEWHPHLRKFWSIHHDFTAPRLLAVGRAAAVGKRRAGSVPIPTNLFPLPRGQDHIFLQRSGVSFRSSATRGGTLFNHTMRCILRSVIGLPSGGTHIFRDACISKLYESGELTYAQKQLFATQMLTSVEVLERFYVHLNGKDMAKKSVELFLQLVPQLQDLPIDNRPLNNPPTTSLIAERTAPSNQLSTGSSTVGLLGIFGQCSFCAYMVPLSTVANEAEQSAVPCWLCKKLVCKGEKYAAASARTESTAHSWKRIAPGEIYLTPERAQQLLAKNHKLSAENRIFRLKLEELGLSPDSLVKVTKILPLSPPSRKRPTPATEAAEPAPEKKTKVNWTDREILLTTLGVLKWKNDHARTVAVFGKYLQEEHRKGTLVRGRVRNTQDAKSIKIFGKLFEVHNLDPVALVELLRANEDDAQLLALVDKVLLC